MSSNGLATERCMTEHLKEAIALNTERRDLYAALTKNQSVEVSDLLIRMEKSTLFMMKFPLWNFDELLKVDHEQNQSLTCEAFVSMKTVRSFESQFERGAPTENTPLIDTKSVRKILKTSIEAGDQVKFKSELFHVYAELNAEPRLNCMSRHIIESMLRITSLRPEWLAKIETTQGQLKFDKAVIRLLRNHIFALTSAQQIDAAARSIQLSGVPIVCQDVPAIHFE